MSKVIHYPKLHYINAQRTIKEDNRLAICGVNSEDNFKRVVKLSSKASEVSCKKCQNFLRDKES
jgi:hypothetical protein